MSTIQQRQLVQRLGYQFTDESLLERALSHRSFAATNNERLEFLGDSLVNLIIAEALYHKFPDAKEGQLSRLRANLVKGDTLGQIAAEFNVGDCLRLGSGEMKSGGHRRISILADALEAIIGAIYLDGGMDVCRDTVLVWFAERLQNTSLKRDVKDAKTRLQEFLQARKCDLPVYSVEEVQGGDHKPRFTVACAVQGLSQPTTATAGSRKAAEQAAAQLALEGLGEK